MAPMSSARTRSARLLRASGSSRSGRAIQPQSSTRPFSMSPLIRCIRFPRQGPMASVAVFGVEGLDRKQPLFEILHDAEVHHRPDLLDAGDDIVAVGDV